MSDDHRMSPDGEYIQFQMENPGIHDAPAPTGDAYEDVDGWAKPGCTVAPATAAVSNLNLQVGETLTREKLDSVFRYLSDFVTAARAEERQKIADDVASLRSPYRSNDRDFYQDAHRESGYVFAKMQILSIIRGKEGVDLGVTGEESK